MSAVRVVPYRGYIEALLLANAPLEHIRAMFTRRSLPEPTPELVEIYRRDLNIRMTPAALQFYATTRSGMLELPSLPPEVIDSAKLAGYGDVFDLHRNYVDARRWFDSLDLRACFTAYVLAGQNDEQIVEAMTSVLKAPASPETVRIYRRFFCDSFSMAPVDWREWIIELKPFSSTEAEIYAMALSNRIPFDLVKWKVHAAIGEQDADENIKKFMNYCLYRGWEAAESLPDESFEIAQSWFDRALKAYTLHKTLGKGRSDDEVGKAEDALFRLMSVREKPRNVLQLERVTRVGQVRAADTKGPGEGEKLD